MALLADSPVVEVSVAINAPAHDVWELVSDINLPAEFQSEFLGAEWLDDGPALNARFVGRNVRSGREWETTSWLVTYEPETAFGWAVGDLEKPGATWTFFLEPTDDGTMLTFRRTLGPGESGLASIIAKYPDREEEFITSRNEEHRTNMLSVITGIKSKAGGQ